MKEHDIERSIAYEKLGGLIGIGLVALALNGCAPPTDTHYYEPFTDKIHYNGDPTEQDILHEETHEQRANGYRYGRFVWAFKYATDQEFACNEEIEANKKAGIEPVDAHPACEKLK